MLAGLPAGLAQAEAGRIMLPRRDPGREPQWRYLTEVLGLAIARSGRHDRIDEAAASMVQSRVMRDMTDAGGQVDVMWAMTDVERERRLLPVRIPLDLGLIGYRLCLVRRADAERWSALRELAELRAAVAGQGHDWPDVEILRANGLKVSTSSRFEALFDMLRLGRIDYFPRSVIEIDEELDSPLAHDLVIEPHLLLRYPAAAYLFVRPSRPQLAEDLRRGLEAAVADGSFRRLFQQHFGALITRHRLGARHPLLLHNPLLPRATPLNRAELWLQV